MQIKPDQDKKKELNSWGKISLFFMFSLLSFAAMSQSTSYTQWANELQFARAINNKWSAEVWLGGAFSNTPYESRVLKTNIQRYVFGWANYHFSARWKISSSLAYYHNKDVPDIGQYFSPEYRLTLQGIYFIHKTGYTLLTRIRLELRFMMNADSVFEDKCRYRQLLKFVKPINSHVLRKGVFYLVSTEEMMFKPDAKTKGVDFFDRNRFELGGGYLITDDLQVELTYVNEFMPRDEGNQIYNIVSLTLTLNNPLSNLKKRISVTSSKDSQGQ
jgi:hypothetical protein